MLVKFLATELFSWENEKINEVHSILSSYFLTMCQLDENTCHKSKNPLAGFLTLRALSALSIRNFPCLFVLFS